MNPPRWLPEWDAKLRELWEQGLSFDVIALRLTAAFRRTFTRSAVAGAAVNRLKLRRGKQEAKTNRLLGAEKTKRKKRAQKSGWSWRDVPSVPASEPQDHIPEVVEMVPAPEPESRPLTPNRCGKAADFWTPERTAALKRLAAEGFSGGEVAERIPGATRTLVYNEIKRLGIRLRRDASKPVSPLVVRRPKTAAYDDSPQQIEMQALPVLAEAAYEGTITIAELGPRNCAWPFDPDEFGDWRYCGKPCRQHEPNTRPFRYCDEHHHRSVSRRTLSPLRIPAGALR